MLFSRHIANIFKFKCYRKTTSTSTARFSARLWNWAPWSWDTKWNVTGLYDRKNYTYVEVIPPYILNIKPPLSIIFLLITQKRKITWMVYYRKSFIHSMSASSSYTFIDLICVFHRFFSERFVNMMSAKTGAQIAGSWTVDIGEQDEASAFNGSLFFLISYL